MKSPNPFPASRKLKAKTEAVGLRLIGYLNSKENLLKTNLSEECQNLLKSLSWKNSRVKNGIPNRWLDNWIDNKNSYFVRDEIKRLVDEIKKIKKL